MPHERPASGTPERLLPRATQPCLISGEVPSRRGHNELRNGIGLGQRGTPRRPRGVTGKSVTREGLGRLLRRSSSSVTTIGIGMVPVDSVRGSVPPPSTRSRTPVGRWTHPGPFPYPSRAPRSLRAPLQCLNRGETEAHASSLVSVVRSGCMASHRLDCDMRRSVSSRFKQT